MTAHLQGNYPKPGFAKIRNTVFAVRRRLNYCLLGQLFEIKAHTQPDFPVLTFEGNKNPDIVETYGDLHENSHRFAYALKQAGIGKGEKFAAFMYNYPEMVHLMAAASILGAVIVPIDPRSKGRKLAHQVSHSKSKALFTTADLLEQIDAIREKIPNVKTIFVSEKPGKPPSADIPGCASIEEIYAMPFKSVDYQIFNPGHPFQIIYTSGTTGDPKGVVHANFLQAVMGQLISRYFKYGKDEVLYTGLSLTHGNAQACTLAPGLFRGLRTIMSEKFTRSRLWDITRKYGATSFSMLGGVASGIYNVAPKPDDRDNPVRHIVSAGMPRAIWPDFEERFNVKILEWYSTLEGGGFARKPIGEGPIGSFGKPVAVFKMKIVDEHDNECPPNTSGEIIAKPRGISAIVNYFDNPKASKKKTQGGWNRTGDIAHKDEDGWYFFDYRVGGGLRRAGDFIQADMVEKVIGEHPDVSDVSVFGIPAESGAPGESDLVAGIVLFEGIKMDATSIFEKARKGLEANSVPSYLLVLDEIPKTISQKPQERFMKQHFKEHPEWVFKQGD